MSIFDECWQRIERADAHAQAFIERSRVFLHAEPYDVFHQMRNDRDGVVKLGLREPFAIEIALELGEFFYQLRAALDSCIWHSYIALGGSATAADAKHLYFPIAAKPSTFNDATFHIIALPQQLKSWIRSVQPCFAGEVAKNSPEAVICEGIELINQCAITDRHRKLHVVAVHLSESTVNVQVVPPEVLSYSVTSEPAFFENEFVIAHFGIDGMTNETQIKVHGGFQLQITIKEISPEPGAHVGVQLEHLSNITKLVVQTFEECFT